MTEHTTIAIEADGQMSRRQADLPTAVARSLAPIRVSISDGVDHRLAAKLLRRLADEIETQQGETT